MIEEFWLLFKSKNAFLKLTLRVFSLACNEKSRRPKQPGGEVQNRNGYN